MQNIFNDIEVIYGIIFKNKYREWRDYMFKLPKLTTKERSWVLYDIANSAFILTVITIFFPILYEMIYMAPHVADGIAKYIEVAGEEVLNPAYTRLWIGADDVTGGTQIFKYMTSILALTVAVISPMIGSWSNYKGNKKKFGCSGFEPEPSFLSSVLALPSGGRGFPYLTLRLGQIQALKLRYYP